MLSSSKLYFIFLPDPWRVTHAFSPPFISQGYITEEQFVRWVKSMPYDSIAPILEFNIVPHDINLEAHRAFTSLSRVSYREFLIWDGRHLCFSFPGHWILLESLILPPSSLWCHPAPCGTAGPQARLALLGQQTGFHSCNCGWVWAQVPKRSPGASECIWQTLPYCIASYIFCTFGSVFGRHLKCWKAGVPKKDQELMWRSWRRLFERVEWMRQPCYCSHESNSVCNEYCKFR